MGAVILILAVLFTGFIIWAGYYLWKISLERYDYNIYNIGVIIRSTIMCISCFLGVATLETQEGSTYVFFGLSIIMLLWTYIQTGKKTTFLIATFAFFYQLIFFVASIYLLLRLFGSTGQQTPRKRAMPKLPENHRRF